MLLFWNFGSILHTARSGLGPDHLDAADVGALPAADAVDLKLVPLDESLVGAERDFDQAAAHVAVMIPSTIGGTSE